MPGPLSLAADPFSDSAAFFGGVTASYFGLSTNPIWFDSGVVYGTHNGLLPGLPYIDPNVGFTTQALGHLAAEDWLHGVIPWWNPYSGIKLPLAAGSVTDSREVQDPFPVLWGAFTPTPFLRHITNP